MSEPWVLPRMLTFLLVPLYTEVLAVGIYGKVSIIFSWFAIFNVILAYGMETAFFRFFNKEDDKDAVIGTSTLSIVFTSLSIFALAFIFRTMSSSDLSGSEFMKRIRIGQILNN